MCWPGRKLEPRRPADPKDPDGRADHLHALHLTVERRRAGPGRAGRRGPPAAAQAHVGQDPPQVRIDRFHRRARRRSTKLVLEPSRGGIVGRRGGHTSSYRRRAAGAPATGDGSDHAPPGPRRRSSRCWSSCHTTSSTGGSLPGQAFLDGVQAFEDLIQHRVAARGANVGRRGVCTARRPASGGEAGQRARHRPAGGSQLEAHLAHHLAGEAVLGGQQPQQQVLAPDVVVSEAEGPPSGMLRGRIWPRPRTARRPGPAWERPVVWASRPPARPAGRAARCRAPRARPAPGCWAGPARRAAGARCPPGGTQQSALRLRLRRRRRGLGD